MSDVGALNKVELVHLVKRTGRYDERDIANARWEAATAETDRLFSLMTSAEERAGDAYMAWHKSRSNHRLAHAREAARADARRARTAYDRAYRRQEKRWKELQSFHMKDVR